MRIRGLIWDYEVLEKLAVKHQVYRDEVKEVFDNRPIFRFVEKGHYPGEDVYSASAQTESGRYLTVFFIHKMSGEALPISARDMTLKERKKYGSQKRSQELNFKS